MNSKIRFLRNLFKELFGKDNLCLLLPVVDLFHKLWKQNGYQYAVSYIKSCRLAVTRYICGKPLKAASFNVALINGFPKRLLFLKHLVDSKNKENIRMVLTVLNISKFFEPTAKEREKIKVDYSTITNPYKGRNWTIPTTFIKACIKPWMKGKYDDLPPHFISTKGSPYGKSSAGSFMIWKLELNILQAIANILGNNQSWLWTFYTKCFNLARDGQLKIGKTAPTSGKLSIVEDPECKRRVIAMLDYTSQWVLMVIHKHLMSILRWLPNDRTYTQDPHHKWTGKDSYHSLDLSAATDRFPIKLQLKVIREIFSHNIAVNWMEILIGRGYTNPNGEQLYYKVGQPMGAYSSWAAFTLTHHIVVQYCAYKCGYKPWSFNNYIILGDDIVIKDNRIAQIYVSLMTRLGVDISPSKTHVSKDTYEFAKRWISCVGEITNLPMGGLGSNYKNPVVVYTILYKYFCNVPRLTVGTLNDLVERLYPKGLKINARRYISSGHIRKTLLTIEAALKFSDGTLTKDRLRLILSTLCPDTAELSIPQGDAIYKLFKDIVSHGMIGSVQQASKNLLLMKKYIQDHITDKELIKSSPILDGIKTNINNCMESMQLFLDGGSDNIYDAVAGVTFLQPTIFDKRSKSLVPGLVSKVLIKGLKTYFPRDGVIMYGSSLGSHSSDTSQFIQSTYFNQVFALNGLEDLVAPEVKENSWESFFK